jgi:hypothetical protein
LTAVSKELNERVDHQPRMENGPGSDQTDAVDRIKALDKK